MYIVISDCYSQRVNNYNKHTVTILIVDKHKKQWKYPIGFWGLINIYYEGKQYYENFLKESMV